MIILYNDRREPRKTLQNRHIFRPKNVAKTVGMQTIYGGVELLLGLNFVLERCFSLAKAVLSWSRTALLKMETKIKDQWEYKYTLTTKE
jgi:hypothetical protein